MEDIETYYDILEIEESATSEEIKKAFRSLSKAYHPDPNQGATARLLKDAEVRFKQINEAYQCLKEPEKRRRYDDELKKLRKSDTTSNQGASNVNTGTSGHGVPKIEISPTNVSCKLIKGQQNGSFKVKIKNTGKGVLSGTLNPDKNWLIIKEESKAKENFLLSSGSSENISFSIVTAELTPGSHKGKIEFQTNGGDEYISIDLSLEKPKMSLICRITRLGVIVTLLVVFSPILKDLYNQMTEKSKDESAFSKVAATANSKGAKRLYEKWDTDNASKKSPELSSKGSKQIAVKASLASKKPLSASKAGTRSSVTSSKGNNSGDGITEGKRYIDQKKYDKAIAVLTDKINSNPDNAEAYFLRGKAYDGKKQYKAAIIDFNKAIEINPSDVLSFNRRGLAYYYAGQYSKALEDMNKCIELKPKKALYYYNRAYIYFKLNQFDRSLESINAAIEINKKDAFYYFFRGTVYEAKGMTDSALADFKIACEMKDNRGCEKLK